MRIAIVTDSTSDLPADLAEANHIAVIPAILVMDGKSIEDGPGISREEFYTQLPNMKTPPTTGSPSAGAYIQLYERLLNSGYDRIISIHVSSLLSGVLNSAKTAAQSFGNRIHIVDSGQVSMGLGFQVLAAAEAVAQGLGIDKVLEAVDRIRKRIHIMALLDTLDYVRRSGRVSWARASLGKFLQIKPLIELKNSVIIRLGEERTRRKGIERLAGLLNALGDLEHLAILHTNALEDAQQFAERFSSRLIEKPIIVNVTSIIGAHVGPNGLGFAAVVK
jgi:DegV family protein with EDD domain